METNNHKMHKMHKTNTDIVDNGYNLWEGYWQSSVYQECDGFIHFVIDKDKSECCKVYFTFRDGNTFSLKNLNSTVQNIDEENTFKMIVEGYLGKRKLVFKLFGNRKNNYIQGIFETETPTDAGTFYINKTDVKQFEYQTEIIQSWCSVM